MSSLAIAKIIEDYKESLSSMEIAILIETDIISVIDKKIEGIRSEKYGGKLVLPEDPESQFKQNKVIAILALHVARGIVKGDIK